MPTNVEFVERVIRIAVGLALLGAVVFVPVGGIDWVDTARHRNNRLVSRLHVASARLVRGFRRKVFQWRMQMGNYALAALLACLLAAPLVRAADEEDHAAHHPAARAVDVPSGAPKKDGMHEDMKKMHELMEKIHASSDPQERQRLMDQHLQAMRDAMKAMRGMGKDMMDNKPKTETPADNGDDRGAAMGDKMGGMMMKKHKMVEKRLDAMQQMMEQMLEHDAAEQDMEQAK